MNDLDEIFSDNYGLSIHDMPDIDFRSSYESGYDPQEFFDENFGDIDQLQELM